MSKVLTIRSNVYPSGMSSLRAGRTLDPVIGLGPRAARFHTLNWKNAHYSQDKCANFASIISRMVNK